MITSGGTPTLGLYDNASAIQKKADITYVDSLVSAIAGGHKGYATLALATTASTSLPANTVLEVTNDPTTNNNGIYLWNGTTLTKSTFDPLTLAKAYADANPMFKPVPIVAGNNVNNFTTNGMYTLSANLPVGQITNHAVDNGGFHQSGIYLVQGITISGIKLVTQVFFPYVNIYPIKVRRQINSGGTFEATWSTISTLEQLNSVFVKPADLVTNNIQLLSDLAQYDYFGKQFTNTELVGTAIYSTSTYYVGLNAIHTKAVNLNKIKTRIYNPTVGDVEYRIYVGTPNVTASANGYFVSSANTGNYAFTGTCKSFPTADNGVDNVVEFDQIISIPANTPFVIAFRHTSMATFRIGYHTALSGNLVSRGFNLGTTNNSTWTLNIGATNPASFIECGFQLLLDVVSSSGGGTTYTPTVILPPKIYALEGLESHIYPENLVQGDYKVYNYDVTCTKGMQKNRGWVFNPTTSDSGTYAISIAAHNKESGNQLEIASSSVIVADSDAKNGQTLIALGIGDSTMQAGIITQRLLDIASTNVMGVTLIGTRGTGTNKHEGRGGWTIADYTGAGRTYYQFTVSGVTVTPAINATTYTFGGSTFLVQETAITSGSGTVTCSLSSGSAPTNGSSGTLTKSNTGAGDASISFSNVQSQSGNPFWNGSAIDFANYLTVNSFSAPKVVFIQLGINDTFSMTSDTAVEAFTPTAFTNLDILINSIKAADANTVVAVCSPQSYADQDAFGYNYQNNQTAWRAKRNIITFNKQLYAYYKDKEAQRIYVVGSGVNMDTENNYPVSSAGVPVNSQNSKLEYPQVNGVHPADSGYRQIGDVWFSFLKSV